MGVNLQLNIINTSNTMSGDRIKNRNRMEEKLIIKMNCGGGRGGGEKEE